MVKAAIILFLFAGCASTGVVTSVCKVDTQIVFTDKRSVEFICHGYEACVIDGEVITPALKDWNDRSAMLRLGHEIAHLCYEGHDG